MGKHINFMQFAYKEALKVKGFTSPNPAVGAIIVKNGKIIAKGATGRPGEPHAEIHALNSCGDRAKGATMYVTLEPCCHYGRTPPCTDAIIKAGIKDIFIGTIDPNPRVKCSGISQLENSGIKTFTGIYKEKLIELNEDFFKYISKKIPFVSLKFAQTLDGKIASDTKDSRWISNEKSRRFVHKLRGRSDSILVGAGTILADNPQLTVRGYNFHNPLRIILDPLGLTPYEANVLTDDNKSLFVVNKTTPEKFIKRIQKCNKNMLLLDNIGNNVDLKQMLIYLAEKEITSILVEGGQKILTSFLENDLTDKIYAFITPQILLSGLNAFSGKPSEKISDSIKIKNINQKRISDDLLITGYIHTYDEYCNL